ncbi:MAG: UvrD-helicase domain-containing protein [Maricaulaceae bacterium]
MTDARAEIVDAATAAQRDAADPRAHAFVSANAGSGKTRVLVDRIARLLLAGADPGAILGLTYTKAAASEMQSRLFARLGAWSVASDPDLAADLADLDPAASTPGAERLSQARRLFARALETPGGLKIQTLHAFCERLLRLFPLEAGLAPGFEVAEEAEAARLRDAATNALVQRADDPDLREALSFFAVRAGDQAQAEAIAFSRTAGAAIAKRAQTLGGAGALVARLAARLGVSPQDTEAGLKAEAWAAAPHNALARAVDVLAQGGKTDAEQSARLAAALAAPDAEAAYDAYLGFLFPQKGLELKESLHSKALGASHPWLERYFGARKGDRRYGMEALRMRAARGHVHAGSVFERSRAALSLGLAYGSAYARAKAGRGVLDFDDLVGRAVDLLTEGEAAGWVLYKLDGGVSHILIDEA